MPDRASLHLPAPASPRALEMGARGPLGRSGITPLAGVALIAAMGLGLCCLADDLSRATLAPSPWIYWAGVAAITAPIVFRLTAMEARTGERIALVCMLGLGLYVVKLMRDPFVFTLSDEFPHAYNVQQILRHHRLFTPNPLLPITPDFPGLEGATSAVAMLTGMSSFGAGIILIGAARITLMLGLFVLFAAISRSSRVAGLGAAAYAGNSNFLLWGAQFAYESLALPLLVVLLACLAERYRARYTDMRAWSIPATLVILAIVPTHHLTSYLMALVLVVIAVTAARIERGPRPRTPWVWPFAALAVVLALLWLAFVASGTIAYVSPVVGGAFKSLWQTIRGEAPPHALFSSSGVAAGQGNTLGEQVVGVLEIPVLFVALVLGLRVAWRRYRSQALVWLLGVAAIGYFAATALRFAPSAWEVANRSAEFLFVGLAFIAGVVPFHRYAPWGRRWAGRTAIALAGAVIVVAGGITGWPANSRMSQPIRIQGQGGTIESPSMTVGRFAGMLPKATFVATEADASPIALFGNRNVLTGYYGDADQILTSSTLRSWELALWHKDHVRYVVVDLRQRGTDNVTGWFFDLKPPAGPRDRYLPAGVASRFDQLPAPRIYDSGDILIYDLQGVR